VLSKGWLNKRSFSDRIRIQFLILSSIIIISFSTAVTLHFLLFPTTPIYITSFLVGMKPIILIPILIVCSLFCLLTSYCVMSTIMLYTNLTFNYAMTLHPIISHELLIRAPPYRTIRRLREPYTLTLFYRSLEVLTKKFNHLFRPVIVITQMIIYQLILVAIYGLITSWDQLDAIMKSYLIIAASVPMIFWGVVLQFGGSLVNNSIRTLKSWKMFPRSHSQRKFFSKFRKSCRPLGIRVDEDYGQLLIKKKSVLNFLKSIVKGTLKGLLALPK